MVNQVTSSSSFLTSFRDEGKQSRDALLTKNPYGKKASRGINIHSPTSQASIFREDFGRYKHLVSTHSRYELVAFAQQISTAVIAPFSVFIELYRLGCGRIKASTCLKNICLVPVHVIRSILEVAFTMVRTAVKVAVASSVGTGFFAWHAGEKLVGILSGTSSTVLSSNQRNRDCVYNVIGMTFLIGPTSLLALPVISLIPAPLFALSTIFF